MREIKFRAWDKKYKKMYLGDIRAALAYPDEDVEIMQYTGLKDKNGKEIYGGDILGQYCHLLNGTEFGKVVYLQEDARFLFDVGGVYGAINVEECKIIGNIYENPELMEDKDGKD